MAASLKSQYGPEIPLRIADMIVRVHAAFPKRAFLRDALNGYEALELMPRGRHIARALRSHLPQEVPVTLDILLASLETPRKETEGSGLASFLYLPHTVYVAEYALDHFDHAMRAHHALTQRFTAEFSIRPFIEKYPERTLAQLRKSLEAARRSVDKAGKPVGIHQFIGRRPIAAFGNSDGDQQMLEWTAAGSGARFMGLVHHTYAGREYAYDRPSLVGQLDKAWDEALRRGWTIVDMKNDWKVIYPETGR